MHLPCSSGTIQRGVSVTAMVLLAIRGQVDFSVLAKIYDITHIPNVQLICERTLSAAVGTANVSTLQSLGRVDEHRASDFSRLL